jgi:hypothetical protein
MTEAMNCSRRSVLLSFAASIAFAACKGDGSNIGPSFAELPAGTCKATVLDDEGRGVSGAVVTVGDGTGVTGRSGRAELYGDRRGTQLVRIDARNASASDSDRLASLVVSASVAGPDLPDAIYLPDTGASVVLSVGTGAALPATDLDDTANSGAILRLSAGTVVADGANPTVDLRIGTLDRKHLPGPLPIAPSGAWHVTRGFFVDPPTATFANGATLVVPDELALGGIACALLRLDPETGVWSQVAGLASSAGGVIQLANAVTTGGLYVYAFDASTATVFGRVVDAGGLPVYGAYVRADSVPLITDNDGRFRADVAAADAQGNARNVAIEVRGGGFWLPLAATFPSGVLGGGASVDLGELELDTVPSGSVRMQLIRRGRAVSDRRVTLSGGLFPSLASSYTDSIGQCTLEDVPSGWFGTTVAYPLSDSNLSITEPLAFLGAGFRLISATYYFLDRQFVSGGRNARVEALDPRGGAQIQEAAMVRGSTPNEGYIGITREGGAVFTNRGEPRLTASITTESGLQQLTSAFSVEGSNGDRVELPLERLQKRPLGAFDRHGIVRGELTGADPLKVQRVLASRPLEFDEWFDARMQGALPYDVMPVRVGGGLGQGRYRAGVALPRGNVAVAEGTVAGGLFTLTAVGALLDAVVAEGTALDLDLPIDRPATTSFVATDALQAFDAGFAASDLRFDLAFQQSGGRIVDVARDVAGNMAVNGDDLTFALPELAGPFAGGSWLVVLSAQATAGTTASSQSLLLRLRATGSEVFPMLALPTITGPLDGATVPATGFTVQFQAPAGADYMEIELRSNGVHTRVWTAIVPSTATSFAFVDLPTEAATPLVAGETYTLTVGAWRADLGSFATGAVAYAEVPTFWWSIGSGDRGVRAGSSRTVTITTN